MKKMSLVLSLAMFACLSVSQAQAGLFGRLRCQSASSCCPVPACTTAAPVCTSRVPVCAQPVYTAPACGTCDGISYAVPTDVVINAAPIEYAPPAPVIAADPAQLSVPAAPARSASPAASYKEVYVSLTDYLKSKNITICTFKTQNDRYKAIIDTEFNDNEKLGDGTICFPTEAAWNAKPELAAEIVSLLKGMGVL